MYLSKSQNVFGQIAKCICTDAKNLNSKMYSVKVERKRKILVVQGKEIQRSASKSKCSALKLFHCIFTEIQGNTLQSPRYSGCSAFMAVHWNSMLRILDSVYSS